MEFPAVAFSCPKKIKEFRQERGFRQDKFWTRVGITQSGGSRYENGRRIPKAVQVLLTVTYGSEEQAAEMAEALRAWRDE